MTKKLDILYQSDNNYAVVSAVSIVSLLENNKDIDLTIHLVDGGITPSNVSKIRSIVEDYHQSINIIDGKKIEEKLVEYNCRPYKGSYVTYYKLIAYGMIPTSQDRILMLDGDIIVAGSVKELCDMKLDDNVMAEVVDPYMPNYLKKTIGVPDTRPYYSAGVMLINLNVWKEQKCESQIVDHWTNVKNDYLFADQDITNILFGERIKQLHVKYNYYSKNKMLHPNERVLMDISQKMLDDVNRDGAVCIHCIDESWRSRPWFRGNEHTMNETWDKYLAMTPWKDWNKLDMPKLSIYHRIDKIMYSILPRPFYAYLLKVVSEAFARFSISKRMLDSKKMNVTD